MVVPRRQAFLIFSVDTQIMHGNKMFYWWLRQSCLHKNLDARKQRQRSRSRWIQEHRRRSGRRKINKNTVICISGFFSILLRVQRPVAVVRMQIMWTPTWEINRVDWGRWYRWMILMMYYTTHSLLHQLCEMRSTSSFLPLVSTDMGGLSLHYMALCCPMIDIKTQPLFNAKAWNKAEGFLREILKGYYSDPPDSRSINKQEQDTKRWVSEEE